MCPSVFRVSHLQPQFTMRQSQCQRCEWARSQPWAAASLSDKIGCCGLGATAGPSDPRQCSSGVGELHHTPEGAWHRGPLQDWALANQHHYPPQAEKRSADACTEARYPYCMLSCIRKEDVDQRRVCVPGFLALCVFLLMLLCNIFCPLECSGTADSQEMLCLLRKYYVKKKKNFSDVFVDKMTTIRCKWNSSAFILFGILRNCSFCPSA